MTTRSIIDEQPSSNGES